jgi:Flp pilus assembly protein TadD
MARLRSGDAAGASAEFGRAVAARPADAGAMGGLAVARDLLGDRAGALAAHREAQALAPEDAELLGNHALSLLIDQRAADAVRLLERFEQNPRAPRAARHNLALAAAAAGQEDRAVRLLREEMSPADALRLTREFTAFAAALRALPPAEAAAALLGLGPTAGSR